MNMQCFTPPVSDTDSTLLSDWNSTPKHHIINCNLTGYAITNLLSITPLIPVSFLLQLLLCLIVHIIERTYCFFLIPISPYPVVHVFTLALIVFTALTADCVKQLSTFFL